MNLRKIKVIVLKGGWSSEREISLKSGASVEKGLKKEGFNVCSFDIKNISSVKSLIDKKIDVCFIALHGKFGEDGTIQAILEGLDIPYTGCGVLSSALCMNKIFSKKLFVQENIPTAKFWVFDSFSLEDKGLCKKIQNEFPVVVKPCDSGSAIGVSIVKNKKAFKKAVFSALKHSKKIIIEKYVEGKEISIGVLEGKALPVIEIRPKRAFYDYTAKYTKGACDHIIPAELKKNIYKKVQAIAVRTCDILDVRDYARVDMIVEGSKINVLEVNTLPGMCDISLFPEAAKAAGLNFEKLVKKMVKLALEH